MKVQWRSGVYIGSLGVLAALLVARALHLGSVLPLWPSLLLLALMTAVFHVYRILLPSQLHVSVTGLVAFLSITAFGVAPAMVVIGCGVLLGEVAQRHPAEKVCFNTAELVVAVAAAGWAYRSAGGYAGEAVTLAFIGPYYAMALTYVTLNVFLLGNLFGLLEGQAPWRFWSSIIAGGWPNVVASLFTGIFLQAVYLSLHLAGVVFIFVLLLGVRFVFKLYAEAQSFYLEVIRVLTQVLELKDPFTSGHSERVARLAEEIGRHMGFVDRELELLRNSALMHDIGKVAVPDSILVKPGPLTAMEKAQMDLHVEAGQRILQEAGHLNGVGRFVAGHHERFDGSGYPQRLAGEAIPLAARIIAVADAFDAMTTDRPYRSALPLSEAMTRLRDGAEQQFDPEVLEVLFRLKGYDPQTGLQPPEGSRVAEAFWLAARHMARLTPAGGPWPAAGRLPQAPAADGTLPAGEPVRRRKPPAD